MPHVHLKADVSTITVQVGINIVLDQAIKCLDCMHVAEGSYPLMCLASFILEQQDWYYPEVVARKKLLGGGGGGGGCTSAYAKLWSFNSKKSYIVARE